MSVVRTPNIKQKTKLQPKIAENVLYSKTKLQTIVKREDNRLLFRISPGYLAPGSFPYAIILELNAFLKEKLVQEIQVTKSGFAIYQISMEA